MECPHCEAEIGFDDVGYGRFCSLCRGYIPSQTELPIVTNNVMRLKLLQQKVREIIKMRLKMTLEK